jgi:hypothetical protein
MGYQCRRLKMSIENVEVRKNFFGRFVLAAMVHGT